MNNKLPIANDNAPAGREANIGAPQPVRHARLTERPSIVVSQRPSRGNYAAVWTPKLQRSKPKQPKPASAASYTAAAMLWAGAIMANIGALFVAPANTLHLALVIAAIWTSLIMVYVAQSRGKTVLAEMAGLAALAAFGLSIYVTSLRFGITTGPATGAALGAFAAAGLGLITGSKLALRISAFAALAWAAISLTGPGLNMTGVMTGSLPKPGAAWLAFPALLAVQAYAMARHRDGAALSVSVLAAYILAVGGLAGLVLSGALSPVLAAATLLLGGLAHSRIGKYMGRAGKFGGALHTGSGTAIMLTGLIALQDYWTYPDRPFWSQATPSPMAWAAAIIVGAALLAVIFFGQAARGKFTVPRLVKAALLTALAGSAAYISAKPDVIAAPLSSYGIAATPLAGIALAGVVLALGLGLIANGIRRHIAGFAALGALAIAASVFLALPAIAQSAETGLIYGVSAFISALIGASFIDTVDTPDPLPYAYDNN